MRFTFTVLMVLACLVSGCMKAEKQAHFKSDSPVILKLGARSMEGMQSKDILVTAPETVKDVPLTTRLVQEVAAGSKDAVVSIFVRSNTPHRLKLLPFGPGVIRINVPGMGLGSGFFVHPAGYIITNNHVVEHAEEIRILTSDGKDYGVAVLARDPAYDLALLKLLNRLPHQVPVLPMGDSTKVEAGDMVIAIGNPLGLGHTVTQGIISQTERNITGEKTEDTRHIAFIQTDTAINPGSSGGPLITMTGAWVGVNTAGMVKAQGIGFAVPTQHVIEFIDKVCAAEGITQK